MKLHKLQELVYKINPRLYYQISYFIIRHRFINFKNPRNLSEYLFSSMLQPEFKQYSKFADKVAVRQYINEKGLSHLLPLCYGVWENESMIDFDTLPDKFALKTNNGCGNHVLCFDKTTLDIDSAKKTIHRSLSETYNSAEPHYKYIKPLVYAEEIIDDGYSELPIDYKFMCVNGKPVCILVCANRGKDTKKCTFDLNWEPLYWTTSNRPHDIKKPYHLDEMIKIACRLSEDFDFVRVDLYDCPNRILFGELTLSPSKGLLRTFTTEALEIMNPIINRTF